MPNTQEAHVLETTGPLYAERNGQTIELKKGDAIYEADVITTGPDTTADILYRDGAKSRIAPNTEFTLTDFEFGPGDDDPSFIVDLTQGAMRTVSGGVVKLNPEAFEVNTPRATVGIRGTEFYTSVEADGTETHAVLYISAGKVMVVTNSDGSSIRFTSPNQFADLTQSGEFQTQNFSSQQLTQILQSISPTLAHKLPQSADEQGQWDPLPQATGNVEDILEEVEEQEEQTQEEKESAEAQEKQEKVEAQETEVQTPAHTNVVILVDQNNTTENLDQVLDAVQDAGNNVVVIPTPELYLDAPSTPTPPPTLLPPVTEEDTNKDKDDDDDDDKDDENSNKGEDINIPVLEGGETINGTNGNDTIQIGKDANGNSITDSGKSSTINSGNGSDTIILEGGVEGSLTINSGNGNNNIAIGKSDDGSVVSSGSLNITTGNQDDNIILSGNVSGTTTIDTGAGDDNILIKGVFSGGSKIVTGTGDDTLTIEGSVGVGIKIDTGTGDDTIVINGGVGNNATIDLGAGNDILFVQGGIAPKAAVNGGDGIDIVVGDNIDPSSATYTDVEVFLQGLSPNIEKSAEGLKGIGIEINDDELELSSDWILMNPDYESIGQDRVYKKGDMTLTVKGDTEVDVDDDSRTSASSFGHFSADSVASVDTDTSANDALDATLTANSSTI